MKRIIAILAIASLSILACNTSTIPGECLEALESYNVPEEAIELIKALCCPTGDYCSWLSRNA